MNGFCNFAVVRQLPGLPDLFRRPCLYRTCYTSLETAIDIPVSHATLIGLVCSLVTNIVQLKISYMHMYNFEKVAMKLIAGSYYTDVHD